MATKVVRYPLAQTAKRSFAAKAAVQEAESLPSPDVKCTVLPNKLMVSTLDVCGPLSRISVVFRVGSRNETPRNSGICHAIRSMTGFATEKCTGFAVWRNLPHNGVHLTCVADRETTAFNIVAARHKINFALKYFSAVVCAPAFKPWEVLDNHPKMKYEIGSVSPQAKTIDMLHKAAFRTGLGNSLFMKEYDVSKMTGEKLSAFYRETFTANRACVASYNMNHNEMLEFAKAMNLAENEPIPGNSTYFGGENRVEVDSYFAHVAVATKGVGIKDIKEAITYSVLQHAYGFTPVIKWGGSPSPLYKATYPEAPDCGVSCLNISYSDAGLFGFFVTGSAETAGKAVEAAFKVIKSGCVTEEDVKRAKALVKMHLLSSSESSETLLEDIGIQSLYSGVIIPPNVLAEAVDKITTADVNNAAKKIANEKFSLAAYGDLTHVPYLDQLQ